MAITRHWVLRALLLAGACLVVTPSAAQQVVVGISGTGAVRFTDASGLACDATSEGSIRYVDASNRVEFCDDTVWTVLGPGGAGSVAINDLTDAVYDTATGFNMNLGSNTAFFAGAQYNVFVGQNAGGPGLAANVDYNTAVGYGALDAIEDGERNTVIGYLAMSTTTDGIRTVAIGHGALELAGWSASNVAIGYGALNDVTSVESNVVVGYGAMSALRNGDGNVALGEFALGGNYGSGSGGDNNVAVGRGAVSAINPGAGANANGNVGIGFQAGNNITSGNNNVVIGYDVDAMSATGNSQLNVGDTIYGDLANDRIRIGGSGAVSSGPLLVEPPATETIAAAGTITANACGTIKPIQSTGSVTTNTTNTFTAPAAANAGCCMVVTNVDTADTITLDVNANFITGAGTDIAVTPGDGVQVCSNGTTWYQGNALSSLAASGSSIDGLSDAVYDTGANKNMRLGSNTAMTAGAANNLFIGESAGTAGTSNAADNNIAIGYTALDALTTGAQNLGIGTGSLTSVTTGSQNTAIGYRTLESVATTGRNIAIGDLAGISISGGGNTALGWSAMQGAGAFTGDDNTAIGRSAMESASSTAANNVALGSATLFSVTGDNNVAIGYQAGNSITTGDANIMIGYDVDASSATVDSELNIGGTIYGDLANDRIRIGGSGTVASGPLYAVPPATETIAGAAVITANACGTIKPVQSTGSVTTNTTNTFTGSTVAGCCMDVINVDAADTITLDANGAFKTLGGANQALGPDDSVRVCSNGTNWYQMGAVSANQ